MLNKTKATIVIDSGIPQLGANKLFDKELAIKVSHTILPICHFYDEATKVGFEVITSDVYLSLPVKPQKAFLISYLFRPETKVLLSLGAKPLALICLESPFIATNFYLQIKRYSSIFKYNFLFTGMRSRASRKNNFIIGYFPQFFQIQDFIPVEFNDKKFLVMVSSGKHLSGIKKYIKEITLKFLYGAGVREIYSERLRAIKYLSPKKTFDLYGIGWDKFGGDVLLNKDLHLCYYGAVDSKSETVKQYKFALCFENSVFPGYITEKIFDAMFVGVVPIYLGAPDIKDFVPGNAFIDFRDYTSWDELYEYLQKMTEVEYAIYIKNIFNFLQSEEFGKFSSEYFSEKMLSLINDELNG